MTAMSWHGIRTMAGQEFRLRIRAGRWRWLLVAWFAVLLGFTFLVWLAVDRSGTGETVSFAEGDSGVVERSNPGLPMFGGVMLFVLGVLLLVVPALTAQSVNGDRERGVLATLQTTLLTPAEIAVGKLLAAWGTAALFVVAAVPMVIWSMFEGGVALVRAVVAMVVVLLLLGTVCAVAQCLSALVARTSTSAVLSYLFVFGLSAMTPIAFGLALTATISDRTITQRIPIYDPMPTSGPLPTSAPTPTRYEEYTYVDRQDDPTKVWWLLAPNPFVILADAAPRPDRVRCPSYNEPLDPLGELGDTVREARAGHDFPPSCDGGWTFYEPLNQTQTRLATPGPVWPYGVVFDVLLGVGAVAITIRRLRAPVRVLPKAVRIA